MNRYFQRAFFARIFLLWCFSLYTYAKEHWLNKIDLVDDIIRVNPSLDYTFENDQCEGYMCILFNKGDFIASRIPKEPPTNPFLEQHYMLEIALVIQSADGTTLNPSPQINQVPTVSIDGLALKEQSIKDITDITSKTNLVKIQLGNTISPLAQRTQIKYKAQIGTLHQRKKMLLMISTENLDPAQNYVLMDIQYQANDCPTNCAYCTNLKPCQFSMLVYQNLEDAFDTQVQISSIQDLASKGFKLGNFNKDLVSQTCPFAGIPLFGCQRDSYNFRIRQNYRKAFPQETLAVQILMVQKHLSSQTFDPQFQFNVNVDGNQEQIQGKFVVFHSLTLKEYDSKLNVYNLNEYKLSAYLFNKNYPFTQMNNDQHFLSVTLDHLNLVYISDIEVSSYETECDPLDQQCLDDKPFGNNLDLFSQKQIFNFLLYFLPQPSETFGKFFFKPEVDSPYPFYEANIHLANCSLIGIKDGVESVYQSPTFCEQSRTDAYFDTQLQILNPHYAIQIKLDYMVSGFWQGGYIGVIINNKQVFVDNPGTREVDTNYFTSIKDGNFADQKYNMAYQMEINILDHSEPGLLLLRIKSTDQAISSNWGVKNIEILYRPCHPDCKYSCNGPASDQCILEPTNTQPRLQTFKFYENPEAPFYKITKFSLLSSPSEGLAPVDITDFVEYESGYLGGSYLKPGRSIEISFQALLEPIEIDLKFIIFTFDVFQDDLQSNLIEAFIEFEGDFSTYPMGTDVASSERGTSIRATSTLNDETQGQISLKFRFMKSRQFQVKIVSQLDPRLVNAQWGVRDIRLDITGCQGGQYFSLAKAPQQFNECLPCIDIDCLLCQYDSASQLPVCTRQRDPTVASHQCLQMIENQDILCQFCSLAGNRIDAGGFCICAQGFYDDGSSIDCQPCFPTCAQCSGPEPFQCADCAPEYGFMQMDYLVGETTMYGGNCLKALGKYYDQNTKTFLNCHEACENCYGPNVDNCLSCNAANYREIKKLGNGLQSCGCKEGRFAIGLIQCGSCSDQCQNCIENPDNCTQCARYRKGTPKCDCDLTLNVYRSLGGTCQLCSITCKTCVGPGQQECLTCLDSKGFVELISNTEPQLMRCLQGCLIGTFGNYTSRLCSNSCGSGLYDEANLLCCDRTPENQQKCQELNSAKGEPHWDVENEEYTTILTFRDEVEMSASSAKISFHFGIRGVGQIENCGVFSQYLDINDKVIFSTETIQSLANEEESDIETAATSTIKGVTDASKKIDSYKLKKIISRLECKTSLKNFNIDYNITRRETILTIRGLRYDELVANYTRYFIQYEYYDQDAVASVERTVDMIKGAIGPVTIVIQILYFMGAGNTVDMLVDYVQVVYYFIFVNYDMPLNLKKILPALKDFQFDVNIVDSYQNENGTFVMQVQSEG